MSFSTFVSIYVSLKTTGDDGISDGVLNRPRIGHLMGHSVPRQVGHNCALKPGWTVALVDMVLHEVTRNETPTSARIAAWARANSIPVLETTIYRRYKQACTASPVRKANLGELSIQEAMSEFGLAADQTDVFLFEDHKIARASFLLPDNCRKVFYSRLPHLSRATGVD